MQEKKNLEKLGEIAKYLFVQFFTAKRLYRFYNWTISNFIWKMWENRKIWSAQLIKTLTLCNSENRFLEVGIDSIFTETQTKLSNYPPFELSGKNIFCYLLYYKYLPNFTDRTGKSLFLDCRVIFFLCISLRRYLSIL